MIGLAFGELGYCGVRKKILFVIESLGGGGAEKVLTTIVKHIDKEKFDVTVCPIVGTGTYVEEVKRYANYRPILEDAASLSSLQKIWYRIKYKLIYKVLPMSWVYRLWIPKGYDTEVAFCEGFVTKLMAESTNVDAKKIAWVHCDLKRFPWPRQLGFFSSIEQEIIAYSRYNQIVTVSKTAKQSFNEVYGLTGKSCTLYNPIDVEDIIQKSMEYDVEKHPMCQLITVGRLTPPKNYTMLLRVVKRLSSEGYRFHLNILGEGEQYAILRSYIESNELSDIVSLRGFCENPYPYIKNSDLMVVSSLSEGYSTAVTESLLLEVPVVTTDCSGMRELLCNGCGVITLNNEPSFFDGLKDVLSDNYIKGQLKHNAIVRSQDFSLKSMMSKIEDILE